MVGLFAGKSILTTLPLYYRYVNELLTRAIFRLKLRENVTGTLPEYYTNVTALLTELNSSKNSYYRCLFRAGIIFY